MRSKNVSIGALLTTLTFQLTTTSMANEASASHDVRTSAATLNVDSNKTSLEQIVVVYQHCTIDGLFCLPSNYSK